MLGFEPVGISDKFSVGKDICVITRWMFIKLFGISEQFPKGSQGVTNKKIVHKLKKMHKNDKTFKTVALFLEIVALFLKTVCKNLKTCI